MVNGALVLRPPLPYPRFEGRVTGAQSGAVARGGAVAVGYLGQDEMAGRAWGRAGLGLGVWGGLSRLTFRPLGAMQNG